MLGADLDNLRLLHLTKIDERSEILGFTVLAQHVGEDALISSFIFLVRPHDRRTNIKVLGLGEGVDGAHLGKRLKSILRHEARKLQSVIGSWSLLVPNGPIMHIAVMLVVGYFFEVGTGRTGRVGSGIGVLRNRAPEDVGEEDYIILPDAIACVGRD